MTKQIATLPAIGLALGLVLAGCAGKGITAPPTTPPDNRPQGQSEFLTPTQGSNSQFGGAAPGGTRGEDAAAGAPAAPTSNAAPAPAPDRLIEESDIYKIVGDHLFVLNRYRGLQIIDIANLDAPRVIGKAPVFGWPKDMYVRGNRAYIIVSDYYTFWREEVVGAADIAVRGFYGSQLRIVDISDPTRPDVVGGINLLGDLTDSRIVGDVMYLVSQRYGWWNRYDSTDNVDKTTVLSVSIADERDVHVVDQKDFPRNGWDHHITVTPNTIYLASSGYEGPSWNYYNTRIKYIDIRDAAGAIRLRGEARVDGMVRDRWSMDEYEGVLRVASGTAWGNGDVHLTTLDVANPDDIRQLGRATLHVNENLTAARFDGPRGYLVTYRNIDPLWVFDLSNPARPHAAGELEMTGWLDFMVPMGDRIVALGHEDTTSTGERQIRLAVSLVDVSSMANPRLISRVTLDGLWGWVPSERDDFAKVFKVIGEQNLVVFPYQGWSQTDYRYIGGVQLIDYHRDRLVRRGLIQNAGWVERGIPHGEGTVLTLSSEVFQVMDIADRDHPRLRGRLELARNVQDFALVGGDYTVQLSGDWYRGDTTVVVTPKSDPDSATPVSSLHVPAPYGRLFVHGNMAYVASMAEQRDALGNYTGRKTRVQVVDLSNPREPRLRGAVELPEEVWLGYRSWYWGSGDEVVQTGSTLAFHRFQYPYYYGDCFDCGRPVGVAPMTERQHKIYLVDLANADAPRLASTIVLGDIDWAWGLRAVGSDLYLSSYTMLQREERWYQRYLLRRIQVANPASPVVGRPINVPGMFVGASHNGGRIYTLESYWDQGASTQRTLFHALAVMDDIAYLRGSVGLNGYVNAVFVQGAAAFASTSYGEQVAVGTGSSASTTYRQVTKLVSFDISDATDVSIASEITLPEQYAYLQKVEGGRAFLGSGAGLFAYNVGNPYRPVFENFFRTQGWASDIIVDGLKAFLPSGYYGVQVLELGSTSSL
jgi:uncharacterized secreted protein with C-terminal beta-propeller domain